MRKKFGKRVLAVLVSTAMVLSGIPVYAAPIVVEGNEDMVIQTSSMTGAEQAEVATSNNATMDTEIEIQGDDPAYLMINERFTVNGVVYKEIGPEQAQLWDASKVRGDYVIPDTVYRRDTGETYEVVVIAPTAFSGNEKLTGITLDERFDDMEGSLFEDCTKLDTVVIEDGCTVIGNELFKNSEVETIEFKASTLEIIGESAFENCNNLERISIPDSIVKIERSAFENCWSLENVQFGSDPSKASLEIIGEYAFANTKICPDYNEDCAPLDYAFEPLVLPDNLKRIEYGAFKGCDRLNNIQFGSSLENAELEYIGKYAFAGTGLGNYNYVVSDDYGLYPEDRPMEFPNSLIEIDDYAFYNTSGINDLVFGTSQEDACLERIGNFVFDLGYGSGGGDERSIDGRWLDERYEKKVLLLPNSLKTIGESVFYRAPYNQVVFGTSPGDAELTEIGANAFAESQIGGHLKPGPYTDEMGMIDTYVQVPVQLPNTLKTIGECAFNSCSMLTDISFGESLEIIGEGAFANSELGSYKKFTPISYTEEGDIDEYTEELEICTIELPDSLLTIGDYAFAYCDKLSHVKFGTSQSEAKLKTIGNGAFVWSAVGYYKITDVLPGVYPVEFPDSLEVIGAGAFCYSGIQLLNISEESKLRSIGNYAFSSTGLGKYLKWNETTEEYESVRYTLELPGTIEVIGTEAFSSCNLERIVLQKGTDEKSVSIGDDAFLTYPDTITSIVYVMVPDESIANQVYWRHEGEDIVQIMVADGEGGYKEFDTTTADDTIVPDAEEPIDPGAGGNSGDDDSQKPSMSELWYHVGYFMEDQDDYLQYIVTGIEPNTVAFRGVGEGPAALSLDEEEYDTIIPESIVYQEEYNGQGGRRYPSYGETVTTEWDVTGIWQINSWSYLGDVFVPSSVVEITERAFCNNQSLTAIKFENSSETAETALTKIPAYAFQECYNLNEVILSDSITEIGEYAFENCESLTSIVIPKSVKTIAEGAFEGCTNLTNIIFESEELVIGERAFYGTGITELIVSENLVQIGAYAFDGCENLTTVHIEGDKLQKLGVDAFGNAEVTAESPRIQLLLVKDLNFKEEVIPDTTWNGQESVDPGAIVALVGDTITADVIGRNAEIYILDGNSVTIDENLVIERDAIIHVMDGAKLRIDKKAIVSGRPIKGIADESALGEGTLDIDIGGTLTCEGKIGDHIKVCAPLTDDMIGKVDNAVFTGSEIKPTPTVTLTLGEAQFDFDAGADYTYSYRNNITAGTAKVTIKSTKNGSLRGAITKEFEIQKAELAEFTASATVDKADVTVTVKVQKVAPMNGGQDSITVTATETTTGNKLVKRVGLNSRNAADAEVAVTWENLYNGTYAYEVEYSGDANHEYDVLTGRTFVISGYEKPSYSGGSSGGGGSNTGGSTSGPSGGTTGGSGGTEVLSPAENVSEEEKTNYGVLTLDPVKGLISSNYGILPANHDDHRSHWELDEISALIWGGSADNYWKLQYRDGSYAAGSKTMDENGNQYENYCWEFINGSWWAFDSNGFAKIGWLYDENYDGWFYIHIKHGMQTGWICVGDKWYYMNPDTAGCEGKMYAAQWTPDGYYVDESGAWDGRPQMLKAQ